MISSVNIFAAIALPEEVVEIKGRKEDQDCLSR